MVVLGEDLDQFRCLGFVFVTNEGGSLIQVASKLKRVEDSTTCIQVDFFNKLLNVGLFEFVFTP